MKPPPTHHPPTTQCTHHPPTTYRPTPNSSTGVQVRQYTGTRGTCGWFRSLVEGEKRGEVIEVFLRPPTPGSERAANHHAPTTNYLSTHRPTDHSSTTVSTTVGTDQIHNGTTAVQQQCSSTQHSSICIWNATTWVEISIF